jgi:hypothetical protein
VAAFDSTAFDIAAFDELAFFFDGEQPEPQPEDDETTTGGIARKKPRKKRRMFVEIDGRQFSVSPELKAESQALIAEIDRLYKQAATIAELRVLMDERLKKEAADEMEAELLLLL